MFRLSLVLKPREATATAKHTVVMEAHSQRDKPLGEAFLMTMAIVRVCANSSGIRRDKNSALTAQARIEKATRGQALPLREVTRTGGC